MRSLCSRGVGFALVIALVAGIAGGWLATTSVDAAGRVTSPAAVTTPATLTRLAEKVKPAVINVNTENSAGLPRSSAEEFFGGDVPNGLPRRSLGSGVIIDASGIALTNAHVVDNASKIEVVTVDGAKHTASVVGMDKKTDLAVLKLDCGASIFPFLPLGDSDETQVGEWVIAVGSPFGLQATVTAGIVSAKARQIGAGPYDDFLQTDAAINPGNSGGPLVNMRGEVIGINTAIVRGGSGIGFAVPSNLAKKISGDLLATGSVSRGWLGVSLQPLTPDLAPSFGAKDKKGALVSDVVSDSPAAKAGVQPGDVVVDFAGRKIENPGDLARAVGLAAPGTDAKLTVWRDKSEKTLAITLAQAPGERSDRRHAQAGQREQSPLGLEVGPVTADLAHEMHLRSTDGVVVSSVASDSPAASAGVRPGDVILEIDRQPVKNLGDFERLTRDAKPGRTLALRLQREGGVLYVAVPIGKG